MLKNDEEIFNDKAKQLSELKKENAQMVRVLHPNDEISSRRT